MRPPPEPLWRRYQRFWRPDVDADVDDELAFHLSMRERDYQARGHTPEEARRLTRARFGDVGAVTRWLHDHDRRRERERHRRERMSEFTQDVRVAIRSLVRRPAFAGVAVLTLALAVGLTTTVFGAVRAVLLRPLPYADAERLVVLWNTYRQPALPRSALSPAELADFTERLPDLEQVSALSDWSVSLGGAGEPMRVQGYVVSPNFFATLRATLAAGRGFAPGEDALVGASPTVVLGHDLWRSAFGGDPRVVGRTVRLDGRAFTVVGVAGPGVRFPDSPRFLFPDRADLWVPHAWELDRAQPRGNKSLRIIGRLRAGGTLARAQQRLDAAAADLSERHGASYPAEMGWRPVVLPLQDEVVGDARPAMLVLMGAVTLVLLIACANVANLLLARGAERGREVAMRAALGAGRARVVRQLLTESLVLALAGGALGLVLAAAGVALVRAFGPASVPRLDQIRVDGSVLAFALATSVGTALLFGTAPGLRLSRTDLQLLVTTGGRGTAGSPARARLGRTLVAAEVSLALVVLVGAGLLLRTFAKLRDVDTGFDARGVLTVQLSLPGARYPSARERTAFFHDVLARAAALPGVEAAGAGHPLPLSGNAWDGAFLVEGQPLRRGQPYPHAEYGFVTPGYFRALGVPLRAGRTFAESDDERAPEVAVIDEELARRYWPGQAAAAVVGRRLSLAGRPDSAWATVVGVVAHVRRDGARAEGEPQIYVPFAQRPQPTMAVVLRTAGDPAGLAAGLRRAVHAVDPDQPLTGLRTMTELTEDALARDRFNVLALGAFAALATLLAAVGLFGVLAYVVAQRSREIGVRMALGARPSDVVRLVIAQGLRPAAAGIAVGLLTAALASRLLRGLLFGVPPLDPSTYAMTSVLLAVVAVAACLAPAWRAARTDPTRAMRAD